MYEKFKIAGIASEFIAAMFASIYFYKYQNTKLKLLLIIMWYIPINEVLGQYLFARTETGYLLYNLYRIIVPASFVYLISTQISDSLRKKIVFALSAFCFLTFLISIYFSNPLKEFSKTTFTIFTIAVLISLLIYFIELLKSDKVLNMSKNLFLWIALGFLIFFISFPVILLAREFVSDGDKIHRSLNYIQFTVAILSYLTIAFGFYYGNKIEMDK
ncbi:hypothetical protein DCS32_08535 [Dokdonia sp. Dokd-P16]|uniref:hypothetical protein n=1 Tax=Dokdonia sp. Dokd-P16 TaxID=2173169 RepID=UPI000D54897B|nr:hypothetical protein [Dokdonia sp. Dokd-P16]AWH74206.1 hypothetical protein DCS32_08535 [Dokdonia sp. Dokd-P16]